jgi:hypothetical protein
VFLAVNSRRDTGKVVRKKEESCLPPTSWGCSHARQRSETRLRRCRSERHKVKTLCILRGYTSTLVSPELFFPHWCGGPLRIALEGLLRLIGLSNFVNMVFVLTQDWKSFVDKTLQIRIFHFGGSILKCTDRFIMVADHDCDVGSVEFGP